MSPGSLSARSFSLCLVGAFALALFGANAEARAEACIDIRKKVSVDGGQTFVNANTVDQAPTATTALGATYKLIVKNCGAIKLEDVLVFDEELGIHETIGNIRPGRRKVFTENSPGFEALGVPWRCEDPHPPEKLNTAYAVVDFTTSYGEFIWLDDYDPAWVICTDGPTCGDDQVDPPETCDPPGYPAGEPNECRDDCTFCGDGNTDPVEECDDGNNEPGDGCSPECRVEGGVCGDGHIQPPETCDPPETPGTGGPDECREDCTFCGDGNTDPVEECDDGNNEAGDGCSPECLVEDDPFCGDGEIDPPETCDPPGEPSGEPNECRDDCTFCGDSTTDPVEECDDGNNDAGDGCSPVCEVEDACVLDVEKTCVVVTPPPASGGECDGKVLSLKLEYTGLGCGATNNPQEGKSDCSGGADGAEPVSVLVGDEKGDDVYADEGGVFVGDVVTATAANAGEDKFSSNSRVVIDGGLEVIDFHTSCSKPLAVGDQFGSVRVVELTTTEGGTTTLPDPDPNDGDTECTVFTDPLGTECDGRPSTLSVRYLGGSCAETTQDQEGKLECSGDADDVEPVRIVASKDEDGGGTVFLDANGVDLGDVVTVSAATGGKNELESNTYFQISNGSGTELQELKVHTSCSKPLALGDRFGALEVVGFDGVSAGGQVAYTYVVSNPNGEDVVVDVVDSELGEIASDLLVAAGDDESLTETALISEDTTNVVVVTGEQIDGLVCEPASASNTVTVEEPPIPPGSCADGKPRQLIFEYTGDSCAATSNTQEGRAVCSGDPANASPIEVVVTKDENDVTVSPSSVPLNGLVTFTATGDKLKSNTVFEIRQGGTVLQSLEVHTSCSKPLAEGDQFGSMLLRVFVPE